MIEREVSVRHDRGSAGFSTLGMIVALVLLGFLLSPLLGTVLSAQRGFVESRGRAQAAGSARYAHLALTRFMRIAGSNPTGGSMNGIDPDPLGDGVFNDIRLRADYNPPDGDTNDAGEDLMFYLRADTMFMRPGSGDEEPYLIGVDSLAFEYYDRDNVLITDPAKIPSRSISARVLIRARGDGRGAPAMRTLEGRVRLRNGR
jgi:type II secretory pathway pseudopilin PulG